MLSARDPESFLDQNEDYKLILLGGLPGSGKTSYLTRFSERGWSIYDDFQANALKNSPLFVNSRHFDELIADLRATRRCVVADIRVVHAPYRADGLREVHSRCGPIAIQVQQYENDPVQCALNVQRSPDRNAQERLDAIHDWSRRYSFAEGALLLRVWSPSR